MVLMLRLCLIAAFSVILLAPASFPVSRDLKGTNSWGYLLQNVTINAVSNSPFELVVIEPQSESDKEQMLSRIAVSLMRSIPGKTDRERIILAYLSIGEAEDYRPYWDPVWEKNPPAWLGKVNPDWEGNYKVRFWYDDWQKLILNQLESILKSDFDGIYLDIVDAWEYWGNRQTYENGREDRQTGDPYGDYREASRRMLDWLGRIEEYIHRTSANSRTDFLLFPQNGEFLLKYLAETDQERYWQIVDGIGVESVFYYGNQDENNPLNIEQQRLEVLNRFLNRGKTVLSVEYLTQPALISQYLLLAEEHGFVPYTAGRNLDKLQLPR